MVRTRSTEGASFYGEDKMHWYQMGLFHVGKDSLPDLADPPSPDNSKFTSIALLINQDYVGIVVAIYPTLGFYLPTIDPKYPKPT
ncbi:unnamed protein product [Protopolystoma xenopodis]|uniref:Uncharacterized protein n=1 Tax=Protopolystoma xenopodis TaxID=117903 RepID=A0A3S5A6Q0_9PLAT|nr:unnamed protein product [Protopolystoma xenopodis]